MANLNKVMIIGNLTSDPEVRTTPSGANLTELRLAVNRTIGGQNGTERREETTFLDVTCWGRLGEIAAQYLAKGRPVFIEGRLQMDSWEDKQTGQKRSRIRIIAENMQLLGSRGDNGGGGGGNYQSRNNGGYQQQGGGYQQQGGGYQQQNNAPRNNFSGGYQGGQSNGGFQQGSAPAPSMPAPDDDDIPF